jgi:hypothetical protein
MFLFRKNKVTHENKTTDRIAAKAVKAITTVQTKFAITMSKIFIKTPVKKIKGFLIVFCLLNGGLSIYLVYTALSDPETNQSITVTPIKTLKHFDKAGDENVSTETIVDERTYSEVVRFKNYMDSLQQYKSKIYDSIMQTRPGLMDSGQMLIRLYNSQKNKAYEK